jgi:predicted nuclease of predicted toxin-antitoxin system
MTEPPTSTPRLAVLVDMNLSPRWIAVLESAGFTAVHWSDLGPVTAPDTDLMAYARRHDMIVLTNDLDFGTILAANGGEKPSVVQIRATDTRPEATATVVTAALGQFTPELVAGALMTIDTRRTRVRLLPLQPR